MQHTTFKTSLVCSLAVVLAGLSASAQAQLFDERPNFLLSVGLGYGGDRLASVNYMDGSSQSIHAGDGISINAGITLPQSDRIDVQYTIGYETSSAIATSGELTFVRMPLEAVALYRTDWDWRLGGGLRYPIQAKTIGSSSLTQSFTPALGLVLEAQYLFSAGMGEKTQSVFSIRYIKDKYTGDNDQTTYRGDHFTLSYGLYF